MTSRVDTIAVTARLYSTVRERHILVAAAAALLLMAVTAASLRLVRLFS